MSLFSSVAQGAPFTLSYSGRFVDKGGAPLAGPVDLQVSFFHSTLPNVAAVVDPLTISQVSLTSGVFQISVSLSEADFHVVFPAVTTSTYIEVKDLTHNRVYPRQLFNPVPFALKVPVDEETISYDSNGRLTLKENSAGAGVIGAINSASSGTIAETRLPPLQGDATGSSSAVTVTGLQGRPLSSSTPNANDALFWNGSTWAPGPVTGTNGGTVTSVITGQGLSGGPIASTGTIDLRLSGSGGLSKALGTDSNELGIASAGITLDKLSTSDTNCGTNGRTLVVSSGAWTCAAAYDDAAARSALSATAPLSYTPGTGDLALPAASFLGDGYLTSLDWNRFDDKQAALTSTSDVTTGTLVSKKRYGLTLDPYGAGAGSTGELRFKDLGANYIGFKAPDALTAGQIYVLPATDGANGNALTTDGNGVLSWASPSGSVTSVNGYSGVVALDATDVGAIASSEKAAASGVASLDASSKVVQDPANAQVAAAAGKIPLGDTGGPLALGWIPATLTGKDADTVDGINGISIVQTSRTLTTAAGSGLSGGGDLSANRSLSLDIDGMTAETAIADSDLIPIYDASATAIRKMTRADLFSGVALSSSTIANSEKAAASGVASLNASSKVVQDPANAQVAAAAGKIPLGDTGGPLALGWIPATLTGKDADTIDGIDGTSIVQTSRTLTTAAGSGLSGGGDLTANRSLSLDINGMTAVTTPDDADMIAVYDDSATAMRKISRANFLAGIVAGGSIPTSEKAAASGVASLDSASKVVQDPANAQVAAAAGKIPLGDTGGTLALGWIPATLTGKDADTIDGINGTSIVQTSRTLTTAAGSGLSGGGDLSANRSLSLDINGMTAETIIADADLVPIYDASATAIRKIARSDFLAGVALSGSTIAASEKAAAGGVASLNASSKVVQDPSNAQVAAAAGKIPLGDTGGPLALGWIPTTLTGKDADTIDGINGTSIVQTSRTLTTAAGSGLSGGGDLSANRSLSLDITGLTALLMPDDTDSIVVYDNSASATRKMARSDFLSGVALSGSTIASSEKAAASGVASLNASSKVVQDPANAQVAAAAGKIPLGDTGGPLALGWIPATLTGKDADTIDGINGTSIVQTSRTLTTAAGSGLSGGGDLSANRSLSLDINGMTAETAIADTDLIPIYDASATAIRKMTKANVFSGVAMNGSTVTTPTVQAASAAGLQLYDDGGNGIFVKDGGNVGIGTTAPNYALDVKSSIINLGNYSSHSNLEASGTSTDYLYFTKSTSSNVNTTIATDYSHEAIITTKEPGQSSPDDGPALLLRGTYSTLGGSGLYQTIHPGGEVELYYRKPGATGGGAYDTLTRFIDGTTSIAAYNRYKPELGLKMDTRGYVGLGNASPAQSLEVSSASDPTVRISEAASATSYLDIADLSSGQGAIYKVSASGNSLLDINPVPSDGTSSATIRLFRTTDTTGAVGLQILKGNNSTTANAFLSANGNSYLAGSTGNVGVGITSPGAKLHVANDIFITGTTGDVTTTSNVGFRIMNNLRGDNSGYGWNSSAIGVNLCWDNTAKTYGRCATGGVGNSVQGIIFSAADWQGGSERNRMAFILGHETATPTEVMSIGATGKVGIGTTNPAVSLAVVGDIRTGTATTNGCVQRFDGAALTGTCSSDERLKKDIVPLRNMLDRISLLRPVNYHWRSDEFPERQFGDNLQVGLIAQEVQKVLPELVITDDSGYLRVNYSDLSMYALGGLVELANSSRAKMDAMNAEIERLEKENEKLQLMRQYLCDKDPDAIFCVD